MVNVSELRRRGLRIPTIDHSVNMLAVRNQSPFGACAAFAMAGMFEFYLFRKDGRVKTDHRMSPLFLWWNFRPPGAEPFCRESDRAVHPGVPDPCNHNKKDKNRGSHYPDYVSQSINLGCAKESRWSFSPVSTPVPGYDVGPRRNRCLGGKFSERPDDRAFRDAGNNKIFENYRELSRTNHDEWIQALHDGHVLKLGVHRYHNNFFSDNSSPVFDNQPITSYGGHAMMIVGYIPDYSHGGQRKEVFKVRNSYGPGWKDRGYCYYTPAALKACASEVVLMKAKDARPVPGPRPPTPPRRIPPAANFDVAPVTGEAPLLVRFRNTSSGRISRYDWDFGDRTTFNRRDPNPKVYYDEGTYRIRLRVTGPGGSSTVEKNVTVATPGAPAPVATGEYNYVWWLFDSEGEFRESQAEHRSPMNLYTNGIGRKLDGPIKGTNANVDFSDDDLSINFARDRNKVVALGACENGNTDYWKWDSREHRVPHPPAPRVPDRPTPVRSESDGYDGQVKSIKDKLENKDPNKLAIDLEGFVSLSRFEQFAQIPIGAHLKTAVVRRKGEEMHEPISLDELKVKRKHVLVQDSGNQIVFEYKDGMLVIKYRNLEALNSAESDIKAWLENKSILKLEDDIKHDLSDEKALLENLHSVVEGIAKHLEAAHATHQVFVERKATDEDYKKVDALIKALKKELKKLDVENIGSRQKHLFRDHEDVTHALDHYKKLFEELKIPEEHKIEWNRECEEKFGSIKGLVIQRDLTVQSLVSVLTRVDLSLTEVMDKLERVEDKLGDQEHKPRAEEVRKILLQEVLADFVDLHQQVLRGGKVLEKIAAHKEMVGQIHTFMSQLKEKLKAIHEEATKSRIIT
ncbi:PKD domain-containing protein [Candidatus Woesearchaeota archaeon]|jgi:hypothetical protein|nr:PKD domain-containing protein [Candidatus Woesearchaeota archaeon]MBT3538286.1 PKD domain-containing protein [Candidatus Woesearchaeota archaeon]MBT4716838.1 PKD domain-containing protein [Candidatus Woesearchaeota archaeon]MBT7105955.1 PKD domain-containing protein [Candidatus Woesearchaeota archaeon]MBT7930440.1 PKD domain-containing protein [Candidatus Woesearchaeota archaeon]